MSVVTDVPAGDFVPLTGASTRIVNMTGTAMITAMIGSRMMADMRLDFFLDDFLIASLYQIRGVVFNWNLCFC